MPDFDIVHHPVLSGVAPIDGARIRLSPLPEGTVLQILGSEDDVARLRDKAAEFGLSCRPNGPKDWFLVSDNPSFVPPFTHFVSAFAPSAVVDQSHGRVRIVIEGEAVEAVLAKGTGLDLAGFSVGCATTTLIGHIATHLTRTAPNRFELMVLRGFAETLWHDLETMSREFV